MFPHARHEDILVQEIGDELIVYDQKSHHAHRLNASAALVWKHCDGQTSVPDLSALLQSQLALPADQEITWLALDRLGKAHLLQPPLAGIEVSRRQLLQRLGFGTLAVLLPGVMSIVVPTPALARGYAGDFICCKYSDGVSGCRDLSSGCPAPRNGVTLISQKEARSCAEC